MRRSSAASRTRADRQLSWPELDPTDSVRRFRTTSVTGPQYDPYSPAVSIATRFRNAAFADPQSRRCQETHPATSRPSRRARKPRCGAPKNGRFPARNLNPTLARPGHNRSNTICSDCGHANKRAVEERFLIVALHEIIVDSDQYRRLRLGRLMHVGWARSSSTLRRHDGTRLGSRHQEVRCRS